MRRECEFDVLIVGGGPAGMAAACCSAGADRRVAIVDDNPALGGQIWRGGPGPADTRPATRWFGKLKDAAVELLAGTQVVSQPRPGCLLAERAGQACELRYDRLVIATGARERFLPFPGWTLPGVVGAGGLQSLVKSGLVIEGKTVAVAGSGPVLPAVAAFVRGQGARVRWIAEQASWGRLARFAAALLAHPGKLAQGVGYKLRLLGARYAVGWWPLSAEGGTKLRRVTFGNGYKTRSLPCDYLACGFGFVPNLELPSLIGCRIEEGAVRVDQWQETSLKGVYCAGEPTEIGGVDLALLEGRIAGYAAVGRQDEAVRLFAAGERARRFARALERAFALRDELKTLATAETVVCRCEDVTHGRLAPYRTWRSAKLHTRCGMGSCQGRVCGPAVEFLFGFDRAQVRPPVFPASLENLGTIDTLSKPVET